jgi:hypothetical protein
MYLNHGCYLAAKRVEMSVIQESEAEGFKRIILRAASPCGIKIQGCFNKRNRVWLAWVSLKESS